LFHINSLLLKGVGTGLNSLQELVALSGHSACLSVGRQAAACGNAVSSRQGVSRGQASGMGRG